MIYICCRVRHCTHNHYADARCLDEVWASESVDAVITHHLPNEKDYTESHGLKSVVLGFMRTN